MELAQNQAVLFKNTNKKKGQPDWIGTINVDGEVRNIAFWFRMAKSNKQFYMLGSNDKIDNKDLVKPEKKRFIPENPYDDGNSGGKPPF